MAAAYAAQGSTDGRQWSSSPRPKGRVQPAEHARNTPCRNIQIYGYCKHEKDGCMYNHDSMKTPAPSFADEFKKRLNVESPSFTPSIPDGNGSAKINAISPKAAIAAPFTPKSAKVSLATPPSISRHHSSEWGNDMPEFVPSGYQQNQVGDATNHAAMHDPFASYDGTSGYADTNAAGTTAASLNPYSQEAANAAGSAAFFQQANVYTQPLQYHLYAPMGPHRDNLLPYQRTAHDFFISESLRQDLQRRSEATTQVLPNSNLPASIEHFHSLVPLDTNNQKNSTAFGYNTWVYKATSSKDGYTYALRRIEGFRLTSDKGIRNMAAWKRLSNANMVTILDCFTTRAFGDSSLVFVTDYHPSSKSLAEQHFSSYYNPRTRTSQPLIPEQTLWGYIVQLASALKAVHGAGLAARLVSASKIILTSKNRVRLNCCGIIDVVQYSESANISALQLDDLRQLGKLILSLATNSPNASTTPKSVEVLTRNYSERFKTTVLDLMEASPTSAIANDVGTFMRSIADQAFSVLDSTMHCEDTVMSELSRELENSRLVRLMAKLGFINERPEYNDMSQGGAQWSETGERYYLKLFRDYVFHQVNAEGRPVIDLGHVISCLNKLDAGSEEKITLTTRDEQNLFIVSYKEVKRGLESAFQDLMKSQRR